MLDSMLYHKIAIDNFFCNKLHPCAPIVRLVIFLFNAAFPKRTYIILECSLTDNQSPLTTKSCSYLLIYSNIWSHGKDISPVKISRGVKGFDRLSLRDWINRLKNIEYLVIRYYSINKLS